MKIENVNIEKGNVRINLNLKGIRDGIMKVESTVKTRGMGIPEYLPLIYDGSTIQTYKSNGWKVTILKSLLK